MKHFFFLITLALFSCGENSTQQTGNSGSLADQTIGDTCDCAELEVDSTGMHTKSGEAYTGTCLSYYEGTADRYLEKNILSGKMHGKVVYYDRGGLPLLEEFYENGVQKRSGNSESGLTCDCAELDIQEVQGVSVYKLDDIPFTGKCEKFYENSTQLYMESSYKNGLLDGYTIYYDRNGSTILMEKYERGELMSAIH